MKKLNELELITSLKEVIEKHQLPYDAEEMMKSIRNFSFSDPQEIHLIRLSDDRLFYILGSLIGGEVRFHQAKFKDGPAVL